MAIPFGRTLACALLLAVGLGFALSNARVEAWQALLPLFEWMETTLFGVIGKTWGGVFAVVQAGHLLSMAMLGGAVLAADGRLLGVLFRDQPLAAVQAQAHRVFVWSLVVVVFTGVFMACGVAIKIYYLPVFWYKMLALLVGVLFAFLVRRPLLADDPETLSPLVRRVVAVASIMVWFTVAATGRWIGFSG